MHHRQHRLVEDPCILPSTGIGCHLVPYDGIFLTSFFLYGYK